MAGKFLSFEGGDAVGKSTQIRHLARWLEGEGASVLLAREPSDSPLGAALRRRMMHAPLPAPRLQALLFTAARRQHIAETIAPACARAQWVLCDRFCDSTFAYQGEEVALAVLQQWHRRFCRGFLPDCTILLDAPSAVTMRRLAARGKRRGFDARAEAWHRALRQRFLALAQQSPRRFVCVDASVSEAATARQIRRALQSRFRLGQKHARQAATPRL